MAQYIKDLHDHLTNLECAVNDDYQRLYTRLRHASEVPDGRRGVNFKITNAWKATMLLVVVRDWMTGGVNQCEMAARLLRQEWAGKLNPDPKDRRAT